MKTWKLSPIEQGRELLGYDGSGIAFRARLKSLGGDRFLFEADAPRPWSIELDQKTHRRLPTATEIPLELALALASSGVDAGLAKRPASSKLTPQGDTLLGDPQRTHQLIDEHGVCALLTTVNAINDTPTPVTPEEWANMATQVLSAATSNGAEVICRQDILNSALLNTGSQEIVAPQDGSCGYRIGDCSGTQCVSLGQSCYGLTFEPGPFNGCFDTWGCGPQE